MVSMIAGYVVALGSFLVLDFVWLGYMGPRLYRPNMGDIVLENFSVPPALAFYALYGVGLLVFAVSPALAAGRWQSALIQGALFGLIAYGTYDLTNQATLKNWPVIVTVVDMAWGCLASGLACTIAYIVVSSFVK